jgi:D-arabinose 1-dehydrogenase-like Zn-dependent alcohol dehydrogenase
LLKESQRPVKQKSKMASPEQTAHIRRKIEALADKSGSSIDGEDTLSFSSLQGIRPMIETVPLANAAEPYGRMMRNEARFGIVLVTE